ncbi:MAG: cephalosporin hydroxylase family protein [Alphaproteobacteria bacterium]
MGADPAVTGLTRQWFDAVSRHKYSYHFTWLGLPVIQFPQDIVAMQEILWQTRPDLVIETGIARGGSLVLHASILELIGGPGRVLGIDVDIRPHNRQAIESHPLARRIDLLEGSSVDDRIMQQVRAAAAKAERVLVILDSLHTHDHVRRELDLYAPLVTRDSYLIVMDTCVEDMPADFFPDRPWGLGDNPKTALRDFLKTTDRFETDREVHDKLQITVAHEGYLRCVRA